MWTDLFLYSSGVYSRSAVAAASPAGWHAVRLLGWGERDGKPYWTVANSWVTPVNLHVLMKNARKFFRK